MSSDSFRIKKALNIEPRTSPTLDSSGDIGVNSTDNELKVYLDGSTRGVVTKDQSQTLTNKTLTSPVISTISNTGTLTLPTSTDTLVGRATTDTLTNKTLTAPTIDAVTFDGQASAPSNPSSGFYKVYVDDTTSKLQILDSSGTVTAIGSGAGGSLNYIENPDAEAATTGWATYADAAGTSPVDGTGGSPTLTFTRTTSSPLRGLASFLITKDAANRQGEGASYNFEIDSADQGKVMQITFDYAIASGTYATGDLAVYVIHDPNGTPKIIQPSGYQIENVGVNSTARLTFQTEVSAQLDYTLCFHVASTSASAYTVKLDNVQLGPQVVPLGAPVTDWVSYTPTLSGWTGTITTTGKWRRVGDSLEGEVKIALGGAPTGTLTGATIPSGFVIDTAKLSQTDSGQTYNSSGSVFDTSGSKNWPVTVRYTSTTAVEPRVIAADEVIAYSGLINATQPVTFASGDTVTFNFRVPIVGWSSSTVVSSSADTRVVAMTARNYSNGTLASGASHTVILNTVATDTHGAYNSATGEYTVKVPGNYSINGEIGMAATAAAATRQLFLYIRVNGTGISNTYTYANTTSSITHRSQARVNWYCNAGDVITLVAENDLGATGTPLTGVGNSNFSINLIQGPSQIAASEVIAARYSTAAAQSITGTGTAQIIDFGTKDFDTHNAVTTGASWKYTAPAPGIYEVNAIALLTGSTGWADTEAIELILYKNNSASQRLAYRDSFGSASSILAGVNGTSMVQLNAGDYIDVRITQLSGGTINMFNNAQYNWVTVKRLGGV